MTTLSTSPGYVLGRRTDSDEYAVWALDPAAPELLVPVPGASGTFDRHHSVAWIGTYFLTWGAERQIGGGPAAQAYFDYRLVPCPDPRAADPLNGPTLQAGLWPKSKFWGHLADFGNPDGDRKQLEDQKDLVLVPLGTFLLNFIATKGRGTFGVWNFDPAPNQAFSADPLPSQYPYTAQGAFRDIQKGHELHPFNGYVLDRDTATSTYRVWSFDPQAIIPLVHPPLQHGTWDDIGPDHQLVPIGDFCLDWLPATRAYRLWAFDPASANPLTGPVRSGTLPDTFAPTAMLTGFLPPVPIDPTRAAQPGTIDYLRTKVKHVVCYMLENRSFDHVVGWLYDKDAHVRVIGPAGPYKGVSTDMYNLDDAGAKVPVTVYEDGKLSTDWSLEFFESDPYHDMSDTLRQMYFANPNGYAEGATPDMGGFVVNNGTPLVMQTYAPDQVPVLNGIAKAFAISDEWFSSTPGATDTNRSFAVTGSAQQQLNNFMSPPQYLYWPEQPHRASLWKTLWTNGIQSWTIYNSTTWQQHVFTYELFLKGQVPSVDQDIADNLTDHVAPVDQFYTQAAAGTLPAFSYIEPIWIANAGTSSYHPGADLVPGEQELNRIYDALRTGPNWNETLLLITFDEHGGIFDHVPPPRAANAWPHDVVDGFRYDVMGVRVPTIAASPWIDAQTIFRSLTDVAYDSTSFMATLLQWFGIPRERWFLGERVNQAPSFESVVTRATPRTDSPAFTVPYDNAYPPTGAPTPTKSVNHLHLHVAHVLVGAMLHGRVSPTEAAAVSHQVASDAKDLPTLTRMLATLADRSAK